MAVVTEIQIPLPPALEQVEGGAVTQGEAYGLEVPADAQGTVRITSRDGTVFPWSLQALAYRGLLANPLEGQEALVEYDYLTTTAPALLSVNGNEIRYTWAFPQATAILRAEAERVKLYLVVEKGLPAPAEYLSPVGLEFVVITQIEGTSLPLGQHLAIDVEPFSLPRPDVHDMAGAELLGDYEVQDNEDGTQDLLMVFDAAWILSAERVGYLTIDPTVVVTSNYSGPLNQYGRQIAELSDGTRLALVVRGSPSGNYLYISQDGGQTYQLATSPANGLVSSGTLVSGVLDVDPDDHVHALFTQAHGDPFYYNYWTVLPDRSGVTIVQSLVEAADGSTWGWQTPDVVVWGNAGQPKQLALCYTKTNINPGNTQYVYARTATVAMDGTLTLGTRYSKGSKVRNGGGWEIALSRNAANEVMIRYYTDEDGTARIATIEGAYVSTSYAGDHTGVDDAPVCTWVKSTGSTGSVYVLTADGTRISSANGLLKTARGVYIPSEDMILIVGRRYADDKPGFVKFYRATGTFVDGGALIGSSTMDKGPQPPRKLASPSSIPLVYTDLTDTKKVLSETVLLNQAPYAAAVTASPIAFAAEDGTTITGTHSDADGDPLATWAIRFTANGVHSWWKHSTLTLQTTEIYNTYLNPLTPGQFVIAAADLAGKLSEGTVYQVAASTTDSQGLAGPYTTTPLVINCGATPVVTPTGPAGPIASSEATLTWNTSSPTSKFRVRAIPATGATIDSGEVAATNATAYTVRGLQPGTYTPEVTVWDNTTGGGIASLATTGTPFVVDFTEPNPVRDLVTVADAALAAVKVRFSRDWISTASFSRASVAYLSDGTQVASGAPRYDTVGGAQGIWIEEATTNLLTANQASVETDTTGFSTVSSFQINSGATITRVTTEKWHGTASLRVQTPGATASEGVETNAISANANTAYTASVWMKAPVGVALQLVFRDFTNGLGAPAVNINGTGSWERYSTTVTTGASAVLNLRMGVRTNGSVATTFYIDGLQIEQKAYATSWHLPGTTRAAETNLLPTSGLSPTQGAWRQWVYVNSNARRQTGYNRVLMIPGALGGAIQLYHVAGTTDWALETSGNGATKYAFVSDTYTPDGLHLFEVQWQASVASLLIDGIPRGTISNPTHPTVFATAAYIGSDNAGGEHLNTLFGQTQHRTDNPTNAESLAAYQLGVNGLVWDDDTTALYSWADTLEGGTQPSIWSGQYEVHRNGTRVAVVDSPASGDVEYVDYAVASGVTYAYSVRAIGDNGTHSTEEEALAAVRFPVPWLIHPTDPAQNMRLLLTASNWIIRNPRPTSDVIPLDGTRKKRNSGQVLGAETELTVIVALNDPRTADLPARFRAAHASGTTWLLKTPQQPGSTDPGNVWEVSMGDLQEVRGGGRIVFTVPVVEVGEARD